MLPLFGNRRLRHRHTHSFALNISDSAAKTVVVANMSTHGKASYKSEDYEEPVGTTARATAPRLYKCLSRREEVLRSTN